MPVEMHNRELLYRQIATQYAQADGERLLRELTELEKNTVPMLTPRLDRRVRAIPLRWARRRNSRIAGLIAAGLVVALLIPQLLRYNQQGDLAMPQEAAQAESAQAPADELEQAVDDNAPEAAPSAPSAGGAGEPPVIPLSFALPENLTVIGVEQDNAQSVYFLSDQLQDDVVLTMEYADTLPDTAGLVEIDIHGESTYGLSTGDYSLLTFHSGGVLYTLTCRHDINTLLSLGRNIL